MTEEVVDPVVTIVTQFGALGILAALILYQFPKWLDRWDKARKEDAKLREQERLERQTERMERAKDLQVLLDGFREDSQDGRAQMREDMRYEREQCAKQFECLLEETEKSRTAQIALFQEQAAASERKHQELMRVLEVIRERDPLAPKRPR